MRKRTTTDAVPAPLATRVERAARRSGVPLDALELLVQDAKVARGFLAATRQGRGLAYVDGLDHDALERRLAERERGFRLLNVPGLRALG